MSRKLVLSAACAGGALVLGVSASAGAAGAATKSTTSAHRSAAASPRTHGIIAGYHGPTVAGAADYAIGVDAPTPAGDNVQYIDFFPRSGLTVNPGQVIDFTWDPGLSPDSAHSATLLASGHTAASDAAANPVIAPDEGESPPLASPFTTFAGTFPPPGSGAPGACGDPATPCTFDGTADLSSGVTGAGSDFFVKVGASTAPGTYVFHCRLHPFMQGSLTVATTAPSDANAIAAAAAAQYASDTAGILDAIQRADHGAYATNPDGTHHVTIWAGTETQYAEALEMLPTNVRVAPGDTVTWKANEMAEIHTVTFPRGHASDSVDPFNFPPMCEASPDTVANTSGPPPTWCPSGQLSDIELPFDPAPHGSTTISSPNDVASSGVISSIPGAPFPSTYSFSFSAPGVYHYQCRIHDNMVGTIFATPSPGYWNVASDGGVFAHHVATFAGSEGGTRLNAPVVGISATPDPGYVLAGSDGGVFALGDATFHGSMGAVRLNKPVVGISETPSGDGYVMAGSDGGIFNFGDAPFFGSMGGTPLNKPVVGVAMTPSGRGYWMVASDGGVFAFGDAGFFGSMGGRALNKPVVGMAPSPSGLGYWLVASDGGVFGFGDAAYHGGMGGTVINKPVVGIGADLGGLGYWEVASDGGIFNFGDAPFRGSDAGTPLNAPMVGIASV
jgi:plastocyanin